MVTVGRSDFSLSLCVSLIVEEAALYAYMGVHRSKICITMLAALPSLKIDCWDA